MSQDFWQWFSENAQRFYDAIDGQAAAAVNEISDRIRPVLPGAVCEIGSPDEGGIADLVISADGDPELIDQIKAMVSAAPNLERWKVTAFRQRGTLDGIEISFRDTTLSGEDIYFTAGATRTGMLGLTLHIRGFDGSEEDPRPGAAMLLMDHAIGEYDAMTMICQLRSTPLAGEPGEELRPLADLPGYLDQVRDVGVDMWRVYLSTMPGEEMPAAIFVKTGLIAYVPQPMRPHLLLVSVPLVDAREDGLVASEQESERLWKIEEELVAKLEGEAKALFVGRVTTNGHRGFAFYAPDDKGLEEMALGILGDLPGGPPKITLELEPKWDFFRAVLQPDPVDFLLIANQEKVMALQQAGDQLDAPRKLEFLVLVDGEETAAAFVEKLEDTDFQAGPPALPEAGPVELRLRRTMDVELPSIQKATLELVERLQGLEGEVVDWSIVGGA